MTVVATGLGGEAARAPLQVVDTAPMPAEVDAELEMERDYKGYDRPPALRRSRKAEGGQVAAAAADAGEEYFDIPAFLRRQAD